MSARVLEIIGMTRTFTEEERLHLVQLLHGQGVAPPMYSVLSAAVRLATGYDLASFPALNKDMQKRLSMVCTQLESGLIRIDGMRIRQSIADMLVRQAAKRLTEKGLSVHISKLLTVLENTPWGELLGNAFPGYTKELLGSILCGELSTGSRSLKSTA